MAIFNGLKKKFIILASLPLVFFGLASHSAFYPGFLEKLSIVEAEIDQAAQKEPGNKKDAPVLNQPNILPIAKIPTPVKKAGKADIAINAKSVLAIDDFSGQVFYEKSAGEKVKIASLTKLVTAGVLLDFIEKENSNMTADAEKYDIDKFVPISKSAVDTEGESGGLIAGEKIKMNDLLKIMLIASSNDAAVAIAEDISRVKDKNGQGIDRFVGLMNDFARREGAYDTHFTNPVGIDEKGNYSTANDIVRIARGLLRDYPEIFEITKIKEINIKSEDGKNDHLIKNTNKLLGVLPGIVGGKTGYTDKAGESLLLAVRDSTTEHQVVAVVVGADGRFTEMEKMINWIFDSYEWK